MSLSEELEVLQAIFPDFVASEIDPSSAIDSLQLVVPVEFALPQPVVVYDPSSTATDQAGTFSVLPSLILNVELPPSYPSDLPPGLSLRSTFSWVPNISRLRDVLLDMWTNESPGVLCTWVEFILSGDFLGSLDLLNDSGEIRIPHPAPHVLVPLFKSFETNSKSSQFAKNIFACAICLEDHKGSKCVQLSCTHVFCRKCLEDFWRLSITEGDVARVGCPDAECVKAKREATEDEIARVVSEDDVQRWRWLKEKLELEKDPSILHCPLAFCQRRVVKPTIIEGQESAWDRLRTCQHCSYAFCSFCKRTWHGPVLLCPISASETLVLHYMELDEGSPDRAVLERRFGRNNILRLVKTYEEEQANKAFIESSTTACPVCNVRVEKSLGCNHMTCGKCATHFCYRCGERLSPSNPYAHFSAPGGPCYNKLFDEERMDWEMLDVL